MDEERKLTIREVIAWVLTGLCLLSLLVTGICFLWIFVPTWPDIHEEWVRGVRYALIATIFFGGVATLCWRTVRPTGQQSTSPEEEPLSSEIKPKTLEEDKTDAIKRRVRESFKE